VAQENAFKELVLLSKAHKALTDEKDALMKEVDAMRDELSTLEALHISTQSRLHEKKELVDQLERKVWHHTVYNMRDGA
jgi:polyhydroxyalkanoate synthesis regulator phasin